MPLDAQDQAAVEELYYSLLPIAESEYDSYFLTRTRHEWQEAMTAQIAGDALPPDMPEYEQGYVVDWYNQLLPHADSEYVTFFLSRTPTDWQEAMAELVATPPVLGWSDADKAGTVTLDGMVATFTQTDPEVVDIVRAGTPVYPGEKKFFSFIAGQAVPVLYEQGFGLSLAEVELSAGLLDRRGFGNTMSAGYYPGDAFVYCGTLELDSITVAEVGDRVYFAVDYATKDVPILWVRVGDDGEWNGDPLADPATGVGGFALWQIAAGPLYPTGYGLNNATVEFDVTTDTNMPDGFSLIDGARPLWATQNETQRWITGVELNGGTVSAPRMMAVSDLVSTLKTIGVWPLLDKLWLLAAENDAQALVDVKSCRRAVNHGAVFTANRGFAGDGVAAYLDTLSIQYQAPAVAAKSEQGFGVWIETAPSTVDKAEIGDYHEYSLIKTKFDPDQRRFGVANTGVVTNSPAGMTEFDGFFHANRTGDAAENLFRNGVQEYSTTDAVHTAFMLYQVYLLAAPLANRDPAHFSTARLAAAFTGGNLEGKQLAFYNAMRTFMTAVGVP